MIDWFPSKITLVRFRLASGASWKLFFRFEYWLSSSLNENKNYRNNSSFIRSNYLISGEYSRDGRRWSNTISLTLLAMSSALLKPSSIIDGLVERHRPSNSTKSFFRPDELLPLALFESSKSFQRSSDNKRKLDSNESIEKYRFTITMRWWITTDTNVFISISFGLFTFVTKTIVILNKFDDFFRFMTN